MSSYDRLVAAHAVSRLVEHDTSLWSQDEATQASIANRLGWTHLASEAGDAEATASRLARELGEAGIRDVVLLGMGGSSLAALTMDRILAPESAGMLLHVLDTTSPRTVERLCAELDPRTTAFFVSSKSGGTIEPNSLYEVFRAWAEPVMRDSVGSRFIAITDPGSSLQNRAESEGFRALLFAPPDVGGRFSALTAFGLAPAACAGVDIDAVLGAGAEMQAQCQSAGPDNPAVQLAAFLGDEHAAGRDKLTLVTSKGAHAFSLWAEQLVAESTGKHGIGIVPVPELADEPPAGYGDDRAVVVLRYTEDRDLAAWALAERERRPVFEIVMPNHAALGAEFVRWEYATALVGVVLGINPFDEPNVAEAKAATADVLSGDRREPDASADFDGVTVTLGGPLEGADVGSPKEAMRAALDALGEGDYLAILAYLPYDEDLIAPLRRVVPAVAAATGRAVVLELGPRYLHSTGQLYKGGPASGVFVMLTTRGEPPIGVRGQAWELGDLFRAQAAGDFLAVTEHGRPIVRIDIPDAGRPRAEALADLLAEIALGG